MIFNREFLRKNGISIAIHRRKGESFSARIVTLGGKGQDPYGKEGLAGLATSLLLHGCRGKTYREIVESLEATGTSLYFSAGLEAIQVSFWSLREFTRQGLETLRDCIQFPDFPEDELEKERQRAISELRRLWDEAEEAASRIFAEKIFPSHPYSRLETPSSLSAIEREDLEKRMEKAFLKTRTFVALAGDDRCVEEALQLILPVFREGENEIEVPRPKPGERKFYFYLKEDAEQVQIRMGHPSFTRDYPFYEEAVILNYILGGGGFSSRLMERIRAKEGLTYSIRSSFNPMLKVGSFAISTFTRPENTVRTIEAIMQEIRDVVKEGVKEEEVQKARSYYIGHFPLGLETPSQIASFLASILFYGLGEDYPERFIKRMREIKAEDVNRIIPEVLFPENIITVVVGNAQSLKQLKELGEVEEVQIPL